MASSWPSLRRYAALASMVWTAALLVNCEPAAKTEPTGGETHFFECDVDTDCPDASTPRLCDVGVCLPASELPTCTKGEVTANQVLVIGDSFFALSHQITAYLEEMARASGALPVGQRYRDNSSLRSNALALDGNGIEAQYASGTAEAEVKVVVMSGGGADVLLGSCDPVAADCPLLVDAVAAAEQLLARMADDGVEHVVFTFYPDPADESLREKVDTLRPLLQASCENSAVPCHWVDLRPDFSGKPDYLVDGINPSADGSRAAAAKIWSAMRRSCVAQ